jgi:hypothetical protein
MLQIFDSNLAFSERLKIVLDFQLQKNPAYKSFADTFGIKNSDGADAERIPLIPVRAFRDLRLMTEDHEPDLVFRSSGTGSMKRSTHFIADKRLYETAIETGFDTHFNSKTCSILAYTPGYNENPDSSLVWMLNHLIGRDESGLSRFLPLGEPLNKETVQSITEAGRKPVLFGAAFGLLDLLEMESEPLPSGSCIIETGGMKTHRREIEKAVLRKKLADGFALPETAVHSEYGMCELLSQCYAIGSEWFTSPHWLRVTIRCEDDPMAICEPGDEGKIGIIDLANVYSCPFLLTDDMGVADENGRFRVLGRWNRSGIRGCNFLIDRD